MDHHWIDTTNTAVTHLIEARSTSDRTTRRLHYVAAGLNGISLLPDTIRAGRRFIATHPGHPSSAPGISGYLH